MSFREQSYEQFVRNFQENNIVQSYYKTRNLSSKLIQEQLVGFCPIFSRYEFPLLRGRLVVPIYDVHDNLLAIAGRQIPDLKDQVHNAFWDTYGSEPAKCRDRINKWTKGKWLNEPYQRNKNLFFLNKAKNYARKKNYLLLVEGYFDVYSFYDNGLCNVSDLCGTSISEYQISLTSRYCDNLVLIMDSDDAGNLAAKKIISKINEFDMNAYQVILPSGLDPDDFANKYDLNYLDNAIQDMIASDKKKLVIKG
jgi:hypothetical protein